MPTINQLIRKGRQDKIVKTKSPALRRVLKDVVCVPGCIQRRQRNQTQP